MPNILDSREDIQKVDSKNSLKSLEELGSQVKQIWELSSHLLLGEAYRSIHNVVVAGMGGSAYGTHVVTTLFKNELKVPVAVVPDYTLPAYVNEKTLVLVSSYSGGSEETLSAAEDAKKKGAQIVGLTSGGKLGEWLTKNNYPAIVFDGAFNQCGVARFGYGYSLFGQMAIFARAGLIDLSDTDVENILRSIASAQLLYSADINQETNPAKLLAFQLFQKAPVIVVSEHLEGVSHVIANAFNENSKTYSEFRVIPELNHHLLEGFAFPQTNEEHFLFITVPSKLYEKSNQRRLQLTEELFTKFHLEYTEVAIEASTKLEEVMSLLVFGVYASFYLAMLYGKDPAQTAEVDWFKKELHK